MLAKNYRFLLFVGSVLLYLPFLGGMHLFDWDEINFAESAREMLVSGDWLTVQIDFKPFWEKPPLFIWMQALSMKLFGINEFAARFPNAIAGILTIQLLFALGKTWKNEQFGFWWAILHGLSFLPFLYFKSGIIDPWFNLFIFSGLIYFFKFYYAAESEVKSLDIYVSALSIGLSVLTKGPVGFLIFGAVIGIVMTVDVYKKTLSKNVNFRRILLWCLVFIIVGGSWFGLLLMNGKGQVILDFIVYQIRLFQTEDAGHGGFPLYHFVIWLLVLFPIGWMSISGLYQKVEDEKLKSQVFWMRVLFWVVLILFSIVKTKIVHYSSMMYFPVSFLAALLFVGDFKWKVWQKTGLWITAFIWSVLVFVMPHVDDYKAKIIAKGWIKDEFAVANLEANAAWTGFESFIVLLFLGGITYFLWFRNAKLKRQLFAGSQLLFVCFLVYFVPFRVEKYSQASAINFCKRAAKEEVPIYSVGYKSYATLFYGQRKPKHSKFTVDEYLFQAHLSPCYFVFKTTSEQDIFAQYPNLQVIDKSNGFILALKK